MSDRPDEFPDEDQENDERAPEPPSAGAEQSHGDAEPAAWAGESWDEPDDHAPEPPSVEAGPGLGDAGPQQSHGDTWEDPEDQAPEPPSGEAGPDGGEVDSIAEQHGLPDDGREWPEELAPEPPAADLGDERLASSVDGAGEQPPEFEPVASPEAGPERAERPGDTGPELAEDEAPEPPQARAEDGPEPAASDGLPEQRSAGSDEVPSQEAPPQDAAPGEGLTERPSMSDSDQKPPANGARSRSADNDQSPSANRDEDLLAATDERALAGSEQARTAAGRPEFAGEPDSVRDASSPQPLDAAEATSAGSHHGAATRDAVGGARERPPAGDAQSAGDVLSAGDAPPAMEAPPAGDAPSSRGDGPSGGGRSPETGGPPRGDGLLRGGGHSQGDGPAGYDSRAAIREASGWAREARLERAVGLPPEPSETSQFAWADADNRQAVDDAAGADRAGQGDLWREDPAISEASTEALRQFGSAMGQYPNDKVQAVGHALQAAGNGLDVVSGWLADRQGGAGEAINAGLDHLVDEAGGGDDPNVRAVMDSLRDRIQTIVSTRAPAQGDEYDQPPLIRGGRRRQDES